MAEVILHLKEITHIAVYQHRIEKVYYNTWNQNSITCSMFCPLYNYYTHVYEHLPATCSSDSPRAAISSTSISSPDLDWTKNKNNKRCVWKTYSFNTDHLHVKATGMYWNLPVNLCYMSTQSLIQSTSFSHLIISVNMYSFICNCSSIVYKVYCWIKLQCPFELWKP